MTTRAIVALATFPVFLAVAARADGTAPLAARIEPPASSSYEQSQLGRATHDVRMTLSNRSDAPVPLSSLALRFLPKRDGVEYVCKDKTTAPDRWPSELKPGGSVSTERSITCETPLPGRYDVEVRAQGEGTKDQVVGTFPLEIEAGRTPPVNAPWDKRLYVAASTTKELRPGEKSGRLFVAVINGSNEEVRATPLRAALRVTQRGTNKRVCERTVELPFSQSLGGGRMQLLDAPLPCSFGEAGIYDVDVAVLHDNARVELGTFAVKAITVPVVPVPRPPVNEPQRGRF